MMCDTPSVTAAIDVPTQVTYGKVIGRFVSYLADSADAGTVPDEVALNGTVLLDPLTVITRWPTTTPPRLAISQRALCKVINGDLCAPDAATNSNPGVWVIATDQPEGEPNIVQWRATFSFAGVTTQPGSIVFNVPTNGVVDLAMIASVPGTPGTITIVSHEDALAAAASAADAAASAADAASAASAAAAALLYPLIATYTYINGQIDSTTEDGVVTRYAYNPDSSIHSDTRNGVTRVYSYDGSGNLAGIAAV